MVKIEPIADSAQLRRAFGCFPSGVTAICALVDGRPVGMAASSFTSVSVSPPLVSVCMQHSSTTWPQLRDRPRLGLSILAEGQDAACRQLASKTGDRFAGTQWTSLPDGSLYLQVSPAWLNCSVHSEVHAGDHAIVLLQIHGLHADPHTPPLVFYGSAFRRLAAV